MDIICKHISICDDDLGCQVIFSNKPDLGEEIEGISLREIVDSIGEYLLLQRTYSEFDFGEDNYYFETHDENLIGKLEAFEIVMSKQSFELQFGFEIIKISMNPTDQEFVDLKRVLPILINKRGKFSINE
ncbi:MAG TPA: hypothetical protein PKV39_02510 [bacterium]|nr:hypothetical protein [bacterium]